MNILRHLRGECIRLDLAIAAGEPAEDEDEAAAARRLERDKEAVVGELAELMDRSGAVVNPTKFRKDMLNRERKATTAIAPGIALPHVRSMQVRTFIMGFARAADPGLPFASLDGGPTRFFFILASPPYEDRLYLQVYREMAEVIQDEECIALLAAAGREQDVYNALRRHIR